MQIPFRQGIIRAPTILNGPFWLQKTSMSTASVDLNVGQEPILLSFAHYDANYLMEETRSVVAAWGSGSNGSNNGAFPVSISVWLYWDVDLATGELTRGWTKVPPIVSGNEPANPLPDTHWFDLVNTRMRVFRKPGASAGNWQDKIRLFAGEFRSNANVYANQVGTQVAINTCHRGAGNLIFGTNNKPLKQSNGTFATTESDFIIYQTSGENVRFDMTLVYRQAAEEIPKFYLVSYLPQNKMKLASCLDQYLFVSGIVIADKHEEEIGQVISSGFIRNEQWDWDDNLINAPLFCGPSGEIRTTPPLVGVVQQVGFIVDKTSIYMQLFPPVRLR